MKFSIITATFNSASTIEACMQSVLQQIYPNLEYIIMDGDSTDDTLQIIETVSKNYSNSNIHITSEPDLGIYDALNKGIAKATGDVIGIVHSDDLLAHDAILQTIAQTFQLHDPDGIYGDLHYVQVQNTQKIIRKWRGKPYNSKFLSKGWMPAHPTLYLKREVYNKEGNFNTQYKIASDYDFVLRVFSNPDYTWQYLPEVIYKMRLGGASNKSLRNIIQKSKEDYLAIKRNHISRLPLWVLISKNLSKIPQFFKTNSWD